MRPLLDAYSDGSEHPIADVRARLGSEFELTEDELEA
jgi:restriction endonuclease Mrr